MGEKKTHRLVKKPKMNARYLADYMAATERGKRRIIRDCKYRPVARIIQHDKAKNAVSKFLLEGQTNCDKLNQAAERLRNMMADSDFDRDVLDNNADYIDAFAASFGNLELPIADRQPIQAKTLNLCGVDVNPDIRFALQRTTRTNKLKTGMVALRYAKGKSLNPDVGSYQSSFMFGYRLAIDEGNEAEPEQKLCITIDAFAGVAHPAPGNALTNFRNMEAACEAISERWPQVAPPSGANI